MKTLVFRAGHKVNLRPPLKKDLPLLVKWINDPEVTHFLSINFPMLEKDEEKWLERMPEQKQTDVTLILTLKNGKAIGVMGLHQINWVNGTATTGAIIGEKAYWGKGYGSEAKMLLLDYAFNRLGLRKICSNVLAFNGRSKRYSEKCGYQEEARRKAQFFRDGVFHDEIWLAVFRENWLPLWKKYQKTGRV